MFLYGLTLARNAACSRRPGRTRPPLTPEKHSQRILNIRGGIGTFIEFTVDLQMYALFANRPHLMASFQRSEESNRSNSTCSICCGFVVQRVVQQIHNKSTTNQKIGVRAVDPTTSCTTNPQLSTSPTASCTTNSQQIHNKSNKWSLS
jgi:hypothetical protein